MPNRESASTFAKGLRVLECFETGRSDLTMADVAQITGFDRAAARRLCLTLEDNGYLIRTNRTFRLAPRVIAIAGGYLASNDIGKSVQPILNQCAEELQGEISLALRDGTRAIYVARSAVGSARLSLGFSVGSTLPLLPTSIGRMLLAVTPLERREQILQESVPERFTEATDTDVSSLRQRIEQAARDGYTYAVGEFEVGATGLAVPLQPIGGSEAVLGTTASINRFAREGELDRALDTLRRAAMILRR